MNKLVVRRLISAKIGNFLLFLQNRELFIARNALLMSDKFIPI